MFTKDLNAMVTHPADNVDKFQVIAKCLDIDEREEFTFDFKRAKELLQGKVHKPNKVFKLIKSAETTNPIV